MGTLHNLDKVANTNSRQRGGKVKETDKAKTTGEKRELKVCRNKHDTSVCWELDTNKKNYPPNWKIRLE